MRAVAHPVRIELLAMLQRDGPLTASHCATELGLTPKVCSYHLGVLGKYGLVEETGGGKGRARPWRLVATSLDYVPRPGEEQATAGAADLLARVLLDRDSRLIESFISHRHALPPEWRNVAMMSGISLRLTPGQLRQLRNDLAAVVSKYVSASDVPAEGGHPVHIALYAIPENLADLMR